MPFTPLPHEPISQRLARYYFRKLARYVQPAEHRYVREVRARTNPQIAVAELLFLRWGIRSLRPQTIVEIGSYCGASTSVMADRLRRNGAGKIYAIDLFSQSAGGVGYEAGYEPVFDRAMAPYAGWFEKIAGDSKTVPWDRPIDLLFIDGDHSEAGVAADIRKYTPWLRPGGLVFLHDYCDVPEDQNLVKSVVDRTLWRDPSYQCVGRVNSLVAFRKRQVSDGRLS